MTRIIKIYNLGIDSDDELEEFLWGDLKPESGRKSTKGKNKRRRAPGKYR